MANYLGRVAILAALYVLTGKLGLLLAVPPGYATIIWPPSGIALGMLLTGGSRLWPGVFLGSFLLNAHHSGAFSDADWASARMAAAAGIALGSTLQALLGRALIARFVGLMSSLEWSDRLPEIKCPTLLVLPGGETVGSIRNYDVMVDRIPDVQAITYEGMPHNICDAVPDRCPLSRFV